MGGQVQGNCKAGSAAADNKNIVFMGLWHVIVIAGHNVVSIELNFLPAVYLPTAELTREPGCCTAPGVSAANLWKKRL
ncbi:hypothetical protein GCM10007071_24010 [Marinobacter zhanjiangensis]|uniref:Uncharacterized protein n=1 Tax=Marinobacter zhanjiangensis TaxID=578215 RepID=A0ABQ3B2P0_9GAMM|nr:hypothetical protein GCM10007071_24010 [Marinobacter zhanjiangensis]